MQQFVGLQSLSKMYVYSFVALIPSGGWVWSRKSGKLYDAFTHSQPRCPHVLLLLIKRYFSFRDSGKRVDSMILLIPLKDNQEKK